MQIKSLEDLYEYFKDKEYFTLSDEEVKVIIQEEWEKWNKINE